MKQINNMEELREFCFGFKISQGMTHRTIEQHSNTYRIDSFIKQPIFIRNHCNIWIWIDDYCGAIEVDKQYIQLDITFYCDFSKCCWEV